MKIMIQPCRVGYWVFQANGPCQERAMLIPEVEMAFGFANGWADAAERRLGTVVPVEMMIPAAATPRRATI